MIDEQNPQKIDAALELARHCYGYGRWNAKHWFIGLEQGLGRYENGDDLTARLLAFQQTGSDGLSDCKDFHKFLGDSRWHSGSKPALQPTWKSLILLLASFKEMSSDIQSRRSYQKDCWGSSDGETCLVEASGIPARRLTSVVDRDSLRVHRMERIQIKMQEAHPAFAVIYGKTQWDHWRSFWKERGIGTHEVDGIVKLDFTTVALAFSPTAFGVTNQYWLDLGQRLRLETSQK